MPRHKFECPVCHYEWYGRRDTETCLHGAQCANCGSYSMICHESVEQQIKKIHSKLPTKEDFEDFVELIEFLYQKGYIVNNPAPEIALQYLIQKTRDSY
jgi:hypothetical protein